MKIAKIRIENLKIKTIIGINEWERKKKQDIIINILITFDAEKAIKFDEIKYSVDYKTITKKIVTYVKGTKFFLLEALTQNVLDLVMQDKRVREATVRIDKPKALRFSDSVSIELKDKK